MPRQKLTLHYGTSKTLVQRKTKKLAIHWSSEVQERYQRNAIFDDLHKIWKTDYIFWFINNIVNGFIKSINNLEDLYTPPNLLNKQKPFILIEILFCGKDENELKDFICKFQEFYNNQFKISIKQTAKKVTRQPSCKT